MLVVVLVVVVFEQVENTMDVPHGVVLVMMVVSWCVLWCVAGVL